VAAVEADTHSTAAIAIVAMATALDQGRDRATQVLLPSTAGMVVVATLSVRLEGPAMELPLMAGMAQATDLQAQADEALLRPTMALKMATTDTHPEVPVLALEAIGSTHPSSNATPITNAHIRERAGDEPRTHY